jgi:hypothetical protein
MIQWLIAILTWLSAPPAAIERAAPVAAAAADMGYASLARDAQAVRSSGGKPPDCPSGSCPPVRR